MGVGQIVFQYLPAINMAIQNKSFEKNKVLTEAFEKAKKGENNLHLIGLLSDGGVHSHIDHLFALIEAAKKNKVKNLFIHIITDGRDAAPKSAKIYLEKLIKVLEEYKIGKNSLHFRQILRYGQKQ
jgi:2,3-bisphosphoglycerate-independent phosphoglycerate mutase